MTDKRRKGAGSGLAAALARAAKPEAQDNAIVAALGDDAAQDDSMGHAPALRPQRTTKAPSGQQKASVPLPSKGREGKKLIGGHFAPEISTQLRILAAEENTTVQALLEEAISDLLTKKGGVRRRK